MTFGAVCRKATLVLASLLMALVWIPPADAESSLEPSRPATYDDFIDATKAGGLEKAISEGGEHIYLPPGRYRVDNPILIDRERPLFLHGANRMATTIVGRNARQPLFLVRRASTVSIAGVKLIANDDSNARDQAAIRLVNAKPLWFEIQDGVIEDSRLEVLGPGTVRIQAVSFLPHGRATSSVFIDHSDAQVTIVGGNMTNHRVPIRVPTSAAAHVHQRRGRLRIFGTGLQAAIGPSDIRIESPSNQGPHALIGIRSEGANGTNQGTHPCRLLTVPSTHAAVDVAIESVAQVCGPMGRTDGSLVDYGGRGTLWLVGNNVSPGARSLVIGAAGGARVFAVGNLVQGKAEIAPVSTKQRVLTANLEWVGRRLQGPSIQGIPSEEALSSDWSAPPDLVIPPALTRPRITRALPGMVDARRSGAVGDGVHDDTQALQRLLDRDCGTRAKLVFLPAGTYRITETLRFNHDRSKCRDHLLGGWIAGAGSDQTRIRRDGGTGGVFETQGLAYATLQGLTFQTGSHTANTDDPSRPPAFALENKRGVGHASQGNSFHDVRFEGGSAALAIGVESPEQCSENLFIETVFSRARFGLAVGAYNALANIVYGGRFDDNEITVGHPESGLSGGTWMLLGVTIRGTRDREFNLRNSATGVWYANGIDSDTPSLVSVGGTGAAFPFVLENASISPRPREAGKRFLLFGGGGGFVFIRSSVQAISPSLIGGRMAGSYLVGLESTLSGLEGVTVGPNATVKLLSPSTPRLD